MPPRDKKHFKTLSLDKSRSLDFDLFSDQEEYLEEEVVKTMAETMEQYMSKTQADYGSGIARPKIKDKDSFELKGQFLKELCDNTFSDLDHEDANKHIKKVLEIVDLFHIPNITIDQVILRAFPKGAIPSKTVVDTKVAIKEMAEYSQKWNNRTSGTRSTETSDGLAAIQAQLNNLGREIKKVNEKVYADQVECEQCKGPYYTKDYPLKEEGKTLEEAYYTQFGTPFQGGGYRAAALRFYQRNNTNPSYQKRRKSMEDTMRKELARDQVDDLVPTIKEGEVVKEFRSRNDARMDKIKYKGNNVVGALMNIPIFVETFSILTDFAVLEDMDAYRDEGMGDIIFGEPFLREVGINAKQFEGMITIYNGSEEVTYQMVRSHSRFKHHTNEQ
nr:hypothetical protein [Tanacetum cinerariifolium]